MARSEHHIVYQPGSTVDYGNRNLLRLIQDGYGFSHEHETLATQVAYEYGNADTVYFALDNDSKEIGSLSIGLRPSNTHDAFWVGIQPLLHNISDRNHLLACYLYGVVVSPSLRRLRIATNLLGRMIEDLNPEVIFGQTNVPEVVRLRANVAKDYGYRTFYGLHEVTPHTDFARESDGRPFAQASYTAHDVKPYESGAYAINTDVLLPYIPKTDTFPWEIQRAFKPIQVAQYAIGNNHSAVSVLVSVKDSLLMKVKIES